MRRTGMRALAWAVLAGVLHGLSVWAQQRLLAPARPRAQREAKGRGAASETTLHEAEERPR
jgi:hypothetical protein